MCNDKAINYLSSIGFNAIQLPKEGIKPLLLMRMRESDCLEGLGNVVDLIEPCTPRLKPDIKTDCAVKDDHLEGLVTDSFGFSFGTEVINGILQQFGVKNNILEDFGFSYKKVRKVKFSFDNILCDATTVGQLARYLRTGQAVDLPEFLEELIRDRPYTEERNRFEYARRRNSDDSKPLHFIVVKTIKSNSLSVWAYDEEEVKVNLTLPVSNVVSLGAGCQASSKSENSVTFKGDKHLIFGVQLAPFWIEKTPDWILGTAGMLIFKYGSPNNADEFTGELFDAPENLGIHPLFDESNEDRNEGKKIRLVRLNHGNPIKEVKMSK
jgi:hypothetical protein